MNDKIVICGANGFLGRAMVYYLARKGFTNIKAVTRGSTGGHWEGWPGVQEIWADLARLAGPQSVFEDAKWVYNFAASVGGVGYMLGPNTTACLSAVSINLNILNALAGNKNLAGYLFTSSACVYSSAQHPLSECEARITPVSYAYAKEKLYSEDVCLAFNQEHGVPVHIARLDGLYGPGDGHHGVGRDHAPVALAKKIVEAKLSGNHEINIWGNGEQSRSFLYIDDAVEGIYRLMNMPGCSAPMNISNSTSYSVNNLVTCLESAAGVKLKRFYCDASLSGLQARVLDNSFMQSELKWYPQVSLVDGARRLFNYQWEQALKKAT